MQHRGNHVSCQICADEISRGRSLLNCAHAKGDLLANAIESRILARNRYCFRVSITSLNVRVGKQFGGGYREDSRSRSNVQETAAREILLNSYQAQTRRLVSSSAEGHAGLNANYNSVVRVRNLGPGRCNDEAFAHFNGLPTLLPFTEPVLIGFFRQCHFSH